MSFTLSAAIAMRLLRRRTIGRQRIVASNWIDVHSNNSPGALQTHLYQPILLSSTLSRASSSWQNDVCLQPSLVQLPSTKMNSRATIVSSSFRPMYHHTASMFQTRPFSKEAEERIVLAEAVRDSDEDVDATHYPSSTTNHYHVTTSFSTRQQQRQQQNGSKPNGHVVNGKVVIVHEKPWQANHLYNYFNGHVHHHQPPATDKISSVSLSLSSTPTNNASPNELSKVVELTSTTAHSANAFSYEQDFVGPSSMFRELLQIQHKVSLRKEDDVTEAMALRVQQIWDSISKRDDSRRTNDGVVSSSLPKLNMHTPPTVPPTVDGDNLYHAALAVVSIWSNTHQPKWIVQAQDVVKTQRETAWYASSLTPTQRLDLHLPIVQAWAHRGDGSRAQTWLNQMKQSNQQYKMNLEHADDPNDDMSHSIQVYNLVLEAWTKHAHRLNPKRLDRALGLFRHMQTQGQAVPMSYSMILSTLAKVEGKKKLEMLTRARELFDQYYQATSTERMGSHDCDVYKAMMELEAHFGNGPQTETLLRQMQQRYDQHKDYDRSGNQKGSPTRDHYHLAMRAWTRSSIVPTDGKNSRTKDHTSSHAVERLLALFQEMKATHASEAEGKDDGGSKIQPSRETYGFLIEGFCRHRPNNQNGNGGWAQQAQRIWEEMLQRYHHDNDADCRPSAEVSFPLVRGWADLARGGMVENIIHQLWEARATPRLHEYRAALEAWSRSSDPKAPERIEGLVNEMWRRSYEEGQDHLKPDRSLFSSTIVTLVAFNNRDAVVRAQNILKTMWERSESIRDNTLRPSWSECQRVLKAWATLGDERAAKDLLRQMRKWNLETNKDDQPGAQTDKDSFRKMVSKGGVYLVPRQTFDAEKRHRQIERQLEKPSMVVPAEMIQETTTNMDPLPKKQSLAVALPQHLVRAHQSVESYNKAMLEIGQGREGALMALALFEEMQQRAFEGETDFQPNVTSYQIAISTVIRIRKPEAVDRAYEIFQEMSSKARLGESHLQPNAEIYSSLLQALSISGYADRCQMLIEQMVLDSCWDQDCPTPHLRLFNIVIASWSRSNHVDAGEQGEKVLRWMQTVSDRHQHLDATPNKVSYSNAIKAWAASCNHDSQRALERSEALFQELLGLWKAKGREDCRPDVVTYLSMATVIAKCSHLSDQEKSQRFRVLLRQMKDQKLELDERTLVTLKRLTQRSHQETRR